MRISYIIQTSMIVILTMVGLSFFTISGLEASEVNIKNGAAAHGYDVVAYFTQSQPVKGKKQFTTKYQGATYRFASQEHLQKFTANPDQFAPQYGGYCAFGTAMGRKFDGNPKAWSIVSNKLYLNLNKRVKERWNTDISGFVRGADNNWPLIKTVPDKKLAKQMPEGLTLGAQ